MAHHGAEKLSCYTRTCTLLNFVSQSLMHSKLFPVNVYVHMYMYVCAYVCAYVCKTLLHTVRNVHVQLCIFMFLFS